MDERMIEAAQTGDINLLYELILNDPYVLERIDAVPFSHTPLHVAASAGHIEFMMEMIKLKPTFARKLNQGGFSPMHLALQNDKTKAVLRLLRFDEGLVRVKGREDLTPLHHVVQTGDVDLLVKLLKVCPEAIEDVTVRDETVFHLAVKNDMVEAFQVLVGWLIRSSHESAQRWEEELLSWADIDGNTVLHIAAIRNRARMVKELLRHLRRDHINAENLAGFTALDIQSEYSWNQPLNGRQTDRIMVMIREAGGLSASSSSLPNTSASSLKKKMSWFEKWETRIGRRKKGMPLEMRNTLLVVTVLIITSTYAAVLNPPKMPDDSPCPSMKYQVSLSQDEPLNSHTFWHKTDFNSAPVPSPSAIHVSKEGDWTSYYSSFWYLNTVTFWAALFLTALLLPRHSFSWLTILIFSFFGVSYTFLFGVSSWSWKHSYEFSKKSTISYFDVASRFNLVLSSLFPILAVLSYYYYVPNIGST